MKRVLAFLLAFAVTFGFGPWPLVFAADPPPPTLAEQEAEINALKASITSLKTQFDNNTNPTADLADRTAISVLVNANNNIYVKLFGTFSHKVARFLQNPASVTYNASSLLGAGATSATITSSYTGPGGEATDTSSPVSIGPQSNAARAAAYALNIYTSKIVEASLYLALYKHGETVSDANLRKSIDVLRAHADESQIDALRSDLTNKANSDNITFTTAKSTVSGTYLSTTLNAYSVSSSAAQLIGWALNDSIDGLTGYDGFNGCYSANIALLNDTINSIHTVDYELNGGTNVSDNPVLYTDADLPITSLSDPTKNGYDFDGWYRAYTEGTGTFSEKVTSDSDAIPTGSTGAKTFYAKWTPTTYTISYEADGGTIVTPGPDKYIVETPDITLPTDVTKSGYTFGGWYAAADFSGDPVTAIPKGSTGAKTFYAKWTPTTYTISYEANEGTIVTPGPDTYTVETPDITLPTDVTKEHYNFSGWYGNPELTGSPVTEITTGNTGDKTFYAKWTAMAKHNITYNNLPSGATSSNPGDYDADNLPITLVDPTLPTGYVFEGWYADAELITSETGILTGSSGPKTFYAKVTLTPYDITYNTNGGTAIAPATYTVESGATLPIPTRAGYDFKGWYEDAGFTGTAVATIPTGTTGDKTFHANWEEKTVTINYNAGTGGTVSSPQESLKAVTETATGSTATAGTGYEFDNWTNEGGYEVSTAVTFTPDKVGGLNVAATYTANFTLDPAYVFAFAEATKTAPADSTSADASFSLPDVSNNIGSVTYAFKSGASPNEAWDRITLDASTGQITVKKDANADMYDFIVVATDAGAANRTAEVRVTLTVTNEYDAKYLEIKTGRDSIAQAIIDLETAGADSRITGIYRTALGAFDVVFNTYNWNNGNPKQTIIIIGEQAVPKQTAIGVLSPLYNTLQSAAGILANAGDLISVLDAYEEATAALDDLASGDTFTKYGTIEGDADERANKLLDYLEGDLTNIQNIINLSIQVNNWVAANPELQQLLSTINPDAVNTISFEDIIADALLGNLPDFDSIIKAALLDSGYLTEEQADTVLDALHEITGDVSVDWLDTQGLYDDLGKAIQTIQTIRTDFQFGQEDGVQLQQAIDFTKSVIDGSIADKYEALDIDSLSDVGTLLDYVKKDVDAATQVVRSADIIDRNLQNYLGSSSVEDYILHYLQDTLPALVDGLLADTELDGAGDLAGAALGALADLEFDGTGTALEYLGYVSQALEAVIDVYNKITPLFNYDGGGYINGVDAEKIRELLGLTHEEVEAFILAFLHSAADDLADVFDNVGVNTHDVADRVNKAIHELVHSTKNFKDFVDELEGLADELASLYNVAAEYLTESEVLDILKDINQYYGEDIKDAVWDLLEGEGITPATLAGILADIEQAKKTVEHYIDRFKEIKSDVKGFIDWASGITEDDIREAAEQAARVLAHKLAAELAQALIEELREAGVPAAIAEIRAKAEQIYADLTELYNDIKDAIDRAEDAIDRAKEIKEWIEKNVTEASIKAALCDLADALEQKALDCLSDLADALKDAADAEFQKIVDKIHSDLADIAAALDCVYDLIAEKAGDKIDALTKAVKDLIAAYPEAKALVDAAIEQILRDAWEKIETAVEDFWQDPDVEKFRHAVEDVAKTVYDGFDYAVKYIEANGKIDIDATDLGNTGAGGDYYTLSTDYDHALGLPFFGEDRLGNTLELLAELGLRLEYRITAGDDAGKFSIDADNQIVGTNVAPGEYELTVAYYLVGPHGKECALAETDVTIIVYPTVIFVDHDGTMLKTEIVVYGGDATAPTDPTRTGYTFTGWNPATFANVTSDLTVTAQYTLITVTTYTVTFVDHDGTTLKTESVADGGSATAPTTDPTRTGYTFSGWDKTFVNITSDLTVTAQYTKDPDPSYGITLSPTVHTFPTAEEGYGAQASFTVTVENIGDQDTGALTIALSGDDVDAFVLSKVTMDSLATQGAISDTFTVTPKTGLAPGIYSATVTVTGANGITGSLNVSFTVTAATPAPPVNAAVPGITGQPAATASYTVGDVATALTVAATSPDGGTLSYQWYSNTANSNTGGTLIPGATNASYTPSTATVGTTYYYVVVTNTNAGVSGQTTATVTSDVAAVTVNSGGGTGSTGSTGSTGGTSTATIDDEDTPLATIEDEGTPLAAFVTERIAYINGYPDGSVHPDGNLTRAEVAAMLFRLLSDAAKNDPLTSAFTDVEDGKWYSQAIAYLADIGILEGYEDGSFKPNAQITRAEFAAVISRFDESAGAAGEEERFSDVKQGHWAFAYIDNAAENGWINGYPEGTFKPQNAITRAEAVTAINNMLYRALTLADVPEDAQVYTDLSESHWAYTDIIEATYDWVAAAAAAAAEEAEAEAEAEADAETETEATDK